MNGTLAGDTSGATERKSRSSRTQILNTFPQRRQMFAPTASHTRHDTSRTSRTRRTISWLVDDSLPTSDVLLFWALTNLPALTHWNPSSCLSGDGNHESKFFKKKCPNQLPRTCHSQRQSEAKVCVGRFHESGAETNSDIVLFRHDPPTHVNSDTCSLQLSMLTSQSPSLC